MSNTHYDRSNTMWIQPAPGRLVRDPAFHDVLPEAGREVEPSEYWQRRLRDGDVIVLKRPAASKPAPEQNMSIPFQNIPQNLRVPLFYVEVDNRRANSGAFNPRTLI